jgi:beta-galactosidase
VEGQIPQSRGFNNVERLTVYTLRYVRVHDQLASSPQYAGGIGWCFFDYNTHRDFGSGDTMCYHGVSDFFRERKPTGGFYKSQCDPEEEIVIEPAFHWARNDESTQFSKALVSSNRDNLKFYLKSQLIANAQPDREQFKSLRYPPFFPNFTKVNPSSLRADLRIDGYIKGKMVLSRSYSGRGLDQKFALLPDDTTLISDGADTTRVVLRVTDEFDNIRPYAGNPILYTLEGAAEIIGDNPFALICGTGAI